MKTGTNEVSAEQVQAAKAQLGMVRQKMTFLLPLTAAERRDHKAAKIGPKKLRMVENRLVAALQHRELLPPAFDLRRFERDTAMLVALGECRTVLDEMRDAVNDTLLAVGNRAVVDATTAYAHIKVAATTAENLKRTVAKLTARRTSGKVEPPAVPIPAKAEPPPVLTPVDSGAPPTDKAA